ncbi:MAG: 4Fe-4S dicluster domain-containing protein [Dehalococcoidales bacterium]
MEILAHKPIRVSELDRNFKFEITAGDVINDATACFTCGTCTAACPIHEIYPEHDPRKIVRMLNLGIRDKVLGSPYIWYCSECFLCEKNCPQKVKFSVVWDVLKSLATKEGYKLPLSINEDLCSGCGICVSSCPFEALELRMKGEKYTVHLVIESCRGCGVCSAACPAGAIDTSLFESKRILRLIEAALA